VEAFASEFDILRLQDLPRPEIDCKLLFLTIDLVSNQKYVLKQANQWADELSA
jgi:hypothetical protein